MLFYRQYGVNKNKGVNVMEKIKEVIKKFDDLIVATEMQKKFN